VGKFPAHDPYGQRENLSKSRVVPYATVLTSDYVAAKMYRAGKLDRPPGRLLADYLKETGGRYAFDMPLDPRLRQRINDLARLNGDPDLHAVAGQEYLTVSLDHLRGLDPDTTRIVVGIRLDYSDADTTRFNLKDPNPPDPKDMVS
jgi:hypothetical protein